MQAVVIEQTGKRWKAVLLVGWVVIGVGFLILVAGISANAGHLIGWGVVGLLAGTATFVTARIGAWWWHG